MFAERFPTRSIFLKGVRIRIGEADRTEENPSPPQKG